MKFMVSLIVALSFMLTSQTFAEEEEKKGKRPSKEKIMEKLFITAKPIKYDHDQRTWFLKN